jgi:ABC-type polysaccharide/polyol phosphate transport system ATPase subunit
MSSDIAIKVENLSKCYQIYDRPQDRLKQLLNGGFRKIFGLNLVKYYRDFWALENINFEVMRGEAVGIIGRNGSGKSTLLQILCGVLNPTDGSFFCNGRIAALLELGSGFNPEFTGRENVYMNGAILGLNVSEINERFDRIADFADIGEFLDQPVKTYSSGMLVRLAFSVAIHSDPEILVVDEALSVGDIAFTNKCLAQVQKLMASGVTILFVSHDLSTLQLLCSKAIWLSKGVIVEIGEPVSISQDYYASTTGIKNVSEQVNLVAQQNTGMANFKLVKVVGNVNKIFQVGDVLRFKFALEALKDLDKTIFTISIYKSDGDWVIGQTSRECDVYWDSINAGQICSGELIFPELSLAPGDYHVAMAAYSENFSICYALTDLVEKFTVRSSYPTWGKFIHKCQWKISS